MAGLALAGCFAVSGPSPLSVTVKLKALDASFPLENATITANQQSVGTNSAGSARLSRLSTKSAYEVNAATLFGGFAKANVYVDGPTHVSMTVNLPDEISETLFRHTVFWKGDGLNWRWPLGAVLRVYFDYASAPEIPDREGVEAYLMAEFRQWEQSGLVTITQAETREEANVFVHFMTSAAWLDRFPTDEEGGIPAGRGGPRPGPDGYARGGEIWFHAEGCPYYGGCHYAPGTAVHEMGHVLGLTHAGPVQDDPSTVMSYTLTDAVTPVDLKLLALKFSLPAHVTVSGRAAGFSLLALNDAADRGWTQP